MPSNTAEGSTIKHVGNLIFKKYNLSYFTLQMKHVKTETVAMVGSKSQSLWNNWYLSIII